MVPLSFQKTVLSTLLATMFFLFAQNTPGSELASSTANVLGGINVWFAVLHGIRFWWETR